MDKPTNTIEALAQEVGNYRIKSQELYLRLNTHMREAVIPRLERKLPEGYAIDFSESRVVMSGPESSGARPAEVRMDLVLIYKGESMASVVGAFAYHQTGMQPELENIARDCNVDSVQLLVARRVP